MMETQALFEIYPVFLGDGENLELAHLPWHDTGESAESSVAPLVVSKEDGWVWAKIDAARRQISKASGPEKADVGLQSLVAGKKTYLGFLPLRPGTL